MRAVQRSGGVLSVPRGPRPSFRCRAAPPHFTASSDAAAYADSNGGAACDAAASAKAAMLRLIDGSQRGMSASRATRVAVQEAVVSLEAFGGALDLEVLAGRWRLLYTTAADVLVLLEAEKRSFGLLTINDIYQSFDAYGAVENLIYASAPLLAPANGIAFRVNARYSRAGAKSIRLAFTDAGVSELQISDALEAAIAPALLPRTPLQMALLQGLKSLNITLPLPGAGREVGEGADGVWGAANAGAYLLSFCDQDTLVGRALTGGGLFIFSRDTKVNE